MWLVYTLWFPPSTLSFFFFFFNDTPTPEIYPLPQHAPFPICPPKLRLQLRLFRLSPRAALPRSLKSPNRGRAARGERSEEHTSELQSLRHLVCRLLLAKKKKKEKDSPES